MVCGQLTVKNIQISNKKQYQFFFSSQIPKTLNYILMEIMPKKKVFCSEFNLIFSFLAGVGTPGRLHLQTTCARQW
jgi:hypothetical protein